MKQNKISIFLKNYKATNLSLDIVSHKDESNKIHLIFILNKTKTNKSQQTIEPKRNKVLKTKHLTLDSEEAIDINQIESVIKELTDDQKKFAIQINTQKNSLEQEVVNKLNLGYILGKEELSDYIYYDILKNEFFDNKIELQKIEKKCQEDLIYLNIDILMDHSLKMNYLNISKFKSLEEKEKNIFENEEYFFNCSSAQFQKEAFLKLKDSMEKLGNKKVILSTNFNGRNKSHFFEGDMLSLERFILRNEEIKNTFFGFSETRSEDNEVEIMKKINEETNRLYNDRINTDKYNVLYTDGSTYKNESEEHQHKTSGAFILNTSEKDFKDVEVRNLSKVCEGEVLGVNLGIKKIINEGLLDKPISLIVDSDDVADSIRKALNNEPKKEIRVQANNDFREIIEMIKTYELEIEILTVKSHRKILSNKIYEKNDEVDAMAINAISDELSSQNITNNIKRRKLKK